MNILMLQTSRVLLFPFLVFKKCQALTFRVGTSRDKFQPKAYIFVAVIAMS